MFRWSFNAGGGGREGGRGPQRTGLQRAAQKGLCPGATMEGILKDMEADRGRVFFPLRWGEGREGRKEKGVQGGLLAPQNSDGNEDLGPKSKRKASDRRPAEQSSTPQLLPLQLPWAAQTRTEPGP